MTMKIDPLLESVTGYWKLLAVITTHRTFQSNQIGTSSITAILNWATKPTSEESETGKSDKQFASSRYVPGCYLPSTMLGRKSRLSLSTTFCQSTCHFGIGPSQCHSIIEVEIENGPGIFTTTYFYLAGELGCWGHGFSIRKSSPRIRATIYGEVTLYYLLWE